MTWAHQNAVWDIDLPASDKIVLLCLANMADEEGVCWPSIATLSRKCSKSERTIQGAVQSLNASQHLSYTDLPGKGRRYFLHLTPADSAPHPRRNCTPAEPAPPQKLHPTPAEIAGDPRRICTQTFNEPPKNLSVKADALTSTAPAAPTPADSAPLPDDDEDEEMAQPQGGANPFPRPDWAPTDLWRDFLVNRKRKDASNTATAHKRFLADIERLASAEWTPLRLLTHATERGWAGIYAPKEPSYEQQRRPHDQGGSGNTTVDAVVARQARRDAQGNREPDRRPEDRSLLDSMD